METVVANRGRRSVGTGGNLLSASPFGCSLAVVAVAVEEDKSATRLARGNQAKGWRDLSFSHTQIEFCKARQRAVSGAVQVGKHTTVLLMSRRSGQARVCADRWLVCSESVSSWSSSLSSSWQRWRRVRIPTAGRQVRATRKRRKWSAALRWCAQLQSRLWQREQWRKEEREESRSTSARLGRSQIHRRRRRESGLDRGERTD